MKLNSIWKILVGFQKYSIGQLKKSVQFALKSLQFHVKMVYILLKTKTGVIASSERPSELLNLKKDELYHTDFQQ